MTWLPIDTAPKDRRILVAWQDNKGEWQQRAAYWDNEFDLTFDKETEQSEYRGAWTDGAVYSFAYEETHEYKPLWWRDLPQPPSNLSSAPAVDIFLPWRLDELHHEVIRDRDGDIVLDLDAGDFASTKMQNEAAQYIISACNLLAGHDLSKVIAVDSGVIETIRTALERFKNPTPEGPRCEDLIDNALAAISKLNKGGSL